MILLFFSSTTFAQTDNISRKRSQKENIIQKSSEAKPQQKYSGPKKKYTHQSTNSTPLQGNTSVNTTPPISTSQDFFVNGVKFTMIPVEGGTYKMGGSHSVSINGFAIGKTEVIRELYKAVMGHLPADSWGDMKAPVTFVSRKDVKKFITKLGSMVGITFRLPTEAEWEFAARGGLKTNGYKYSGSNNIDEVAWYCDNTEDIQPVATKKANELGIFDMSGGVAEYCSDYYAEYPNEHKNNPQGPSNGSNMVLRGGHWLWDGSAEACEVSKRDFVDPDFDSCCVGFRLAM